MPRDGAIIFGDLIGKLDMLHVTCDKCGRKGRYAVPRLIEQRGRDAKVNGRRRPRYSPHLAQTHGRGADTAFGTKTVAENYIASSDRQLGKGGPCPSSL